ncbi:MAG: polyamine ABC transporter substrate-binding protein [Desulfobacteraceae bacterium]|nr:polyamine ABC transporter substrate-binding protein [Desulfobacteraceae bacterium]
MASLASPGYSETVLKIGTLGSDAISLDPHKSTKSQDKIIFPMIFNGLVRFQQGTADLNTIEPDLAESWEASPDKLVWTFKLRKGVQFHSGYGELTADDVVFSLTKAADKSSSSAYKEYAAVKSIEAKDAYTVVVTLKEKVPFFLGAVINYHGGFILSKKAWEDFGDQAPMHPVGTGPFEFVSYQSKRFIELKANTAYFRGKPHIDKIVYRYMPDEATRELAFDRKEVDLFYGRREARWVKAQAAKKNCIVDVFGLGELRNFHLNTSVKPLDDIRVRQAIAHAVNRKNLVTFIGPEVSAAANSVVPAGYLGHSDTATVYEHDLNKAKELLAQAGFAKGLTIKAVITKVDSLRLPMVVIQEQLRLAGITLDLQVVEHSAFHKLIRQNQSGVVLYGASRFPIADVYLSQFFLSDSIVGTPTGVTNFSHSKVADDEIRSAKTEADLNRQVKLWALAQDKIQKEVFAVPLFEQYLVWCRSANLDYGYDLKNSLSNGPLITEKTRLN